MPEFIKVVRSDWELLAQTAVWLYGIIAAYLTPLPYDYDYATVTTGADPSLRYQSIVFGKFITTVLLGLFILPARRWKRRRYQWRWAACATILLAVSVVAYFSQQNATATCVIVYSGERILIGKALTQEASDYLRSNNVTTRELMDHFNVSRLDKIWTVESMNKCRGDLLIWYLFPLLAGVLCVLTTMQAIRCARSRS